MNALVVYESLYGNTRKVADAIADGLRDAAHVDVLAVADAPASSLAAADMLVVGGPRTSMALPPPCRARARATTP